MSQNSSSSDSFCGAPPPPPPMQIHCVSRKVHPSKEGPQGRHSSREAPLSKQISSDSVLVGTIDAKAVGGGSGVLYSCVNGAPAPQRGGQQGQGSQGGTSRVNPSDPQVRKLVYNMYRGLLSTKHERATNIVESAPEDLVATDQGVGDRVVSMMWVRRAFVFLWKHGHYVTSLSDSWIHKRLHLRGN